MAEDEDTSENKVKMDDANEKEKDDKLIKIPGTTTQSPQENHMSFKPKKAKNILLMLMLTSTIVAGKNENEFRTGIKEIGHHKIADSNEIYDFIIPLDLEVYKVARTLIMKQVVGYEKERRKFHKKELNISKDIKRVFFLLDKKIEDLDRLAKLIPEFGEAMKEKYREKRQIAAIAGASLASFLLGHILNFGESDRMDSIEDRFKIFSEHGLEFEEAQIAITNELSREVLKINKKIQKFSDNEDKYKVLVEKKEGILSLMSILDDSVERVLEVVKGALNGEVATIIEFPEKIDKAIKTVEKNSRSEAYIKNLGIYAKISKVEIFREGSVLVIRDRITIPLRDRVKVMRSFMTFWITSTDGEKLVKPILTKENVIVDNSLTLEISNEEYDECIDIEDIKVCNNFPEVYHAPGHRDCVSKIALNRSIEEIHESCNWITDSMSKSRATRLDENTFVIATKEDSSILMDCEKREGIKYLKLHKGNNVLYAESNCLIKDEGMFPEFSFRTPANEKDIKFEILNIKATFIDPNVEELNNGIDEEEEKLKALEILQNKFDEIEAMDNDNFTVDLHRALNALNMSHEKNVKVNKDIKQKLHHKNIWDYAIVGAIGLASIIILTMGVIFRTVYIQMKETIKTLNKNKATNITFNNKSSQVGDLFRSLDWKRQGMILLASTLDSKDTKHNLYDMMLEVAKENDIKLNFNDMPEVIHTYFNEETLEKTVMDFNKRVEEKT